MKLVMFLFAAGMVIFAAISMQGVEKLRRQQIAEDHFWVRDQHAFFRAYDRDDQRGIAAALAAQQRDLKEEEDAR